MSSVLNKISSVLRSEKGALSVEYGLILSGVAALGILIVTQLTGPTTSIKNSLAQVFQAVITETKIN